RLIHPHNPISSADIDGVAGTHAVGACRCRVATAAAASTSTAAAGAGSSGSGAGGNKPAFDYSGHVPCRERSRCDMHFAPHLAEVVDEIGGFGCVTLVVGNHERVRCR